MSRRRFFVDAVRNGQAEIAGEEARHLTRVLRVEPGQVFEICDNAAVYLAEVESARKEHVVFQVREKLDPRPATVTLHLAAALIKFDHFEWMIEKATELGVSSIRPVIAVRSEKGLDRAADKRMERWRRIALEASQQARRDRLPSIELPAPLREVAARTSTCSLFFDEEGGTPVLNALPPVRSARDEVTLLIGPEGGWTEAERAWILSNGWTRASLGPLVLRAETAAISALAVVSAAWHAV